MGSKNIVVSVAIGLIIVFFILGWFVSVVVYYELINLVLPESSNHQLVHRKISGDFFIQLRASLMFAALPLFVWLILTIQYRFKKKNFHLKEYFMILLVLTGTFLLGAIFRTYTLKFLVAQFSEIESVIPSYDIESFKFYQWGFAFSIIASLIVFFIRKRNEKMTD